MRKLLTIILLIIVLSLSACNDSKATANDLGAAGAENALEQTSDNSLQADNSTSTNTETPIPESKQEEEEQIVEPLWYMDSEGLKNKTLGIQIKRDNGIMDELCVRAPYMIYTPAISEKTGEQVWRGTQSTFNCYYCDDNIDDYIAQNEGYAKGTWNDLSYAYVRGFGIEVNFIGNGVRLYTSVDYPEDRNSIDNMETYINDYLTEIDLIRSYSDSPIDCLAFNAQDGLYCPALNIKISQKGSKHKVRDLSVYCTNSDYSRITISDENIGKMYYMADANCALDVINNYVNGSISDVNENNVARYIAVEETVEVTKGKNTFLGRGIYENSEYSEWSSDDEKWLFYSDTSNWSIELQYDMGDSYQKYLDIILPLE